MFSLEIPLIKAKREHFRNQIRKQLLEQSFNQKRQDSLLHIMITQSQDEPKDSEHQLQIFYDEHQQQQNKIECPDLIARINHILILVSEQINKESQLELIQQLIIIISSKIEVIADQLIQNNFCGEIMTLILQYKDDRILLNTFFKLISIMIDQSIQLRFEIISVGFVQIVNSLIISSEIIEYSECITSLLRIIETLLDSQNRIPKELTQDLILSINLMFKSMINRNNEGAQEFATLKKLSQLLAHYSQNSVQNINFILRSNSMMNFIIEQSIQNNLNLRVFTIKVLKNMTMESNTQKTYLLNKYPQLTFQLQELLNNCKSGSLIIQPKSIFLKSLQTYNLQFVNYCIKNDSDYVKYRIYWRVIQIIERINEIYSIILNL